MKILKEKKKFYLIYSLIFIGLSSLIIYFYYSKGKSVVTYGGDGTRQFYRALVYLSQHFIQIINNIFVNHSFILPQWDFAIGEGSDIIEVFHYYGLGDPLNILSIIFSKEKLYIFYDLSIFIRLYLIGFVFSYLCFYENKRNEIAILSGTILYSFSSYAISAMSGHISFLNSLLYFPLVILGVEKLIKENKWIVLSISVFLTSISSIYFFYMIVVATIIYVVVRVFLLEKTFKEKIIAVLKITIYSFLGVLLSSIVFMPVAYSMINNSRISTKISSSLFYPLSDYIKYISSFVYGNYVGSFYGGYTVIGLFCLITTLKKKNNKLLKILLGIILVFLIFTFFGKLFNAMIYVTDRWHFVVDLLMCYVIVDSFDDLIMIKKEVIAYMLALISVLSVSIYMNKDEWKVYCLFLILGLAVLLCIFLSKNKTIKQYICFLAIFISVLFSILYKYLPSYWNYAERGTDFSILENMNKEEYSIFETIDDNTFYRYSGDSLTTNSSIQGDVSSTGYYWSVANSNVMDFRRLLGLSDHNNHHYDSYDDDYILNSLSSVKYYVKKQNDNVPHNYNLFKSFNDYDIYKNADVLPLIYGYNKTISIKDFVNQDLLNRQEMLTQYVVIDSQESINNNYDTNNINIDYKIKSIDGLTIDNEIYHVEKANALLSYDISSKSIGEYYLIVRDFYCDDNTNIKVSFNGIDKTLIYKCESNGGYANRHNFAINLGYYEGTNGIIDITFPDVLDIQCSTIEIKCLPLDKMINNINSLNCVKIDNLLVDDNVVTSSINIDDNKHLVFAIPYSKGWKLYINGAEKKLSKANIMYMGFDAEKGHHEIKLEYKTPLLKEGAIITGISFAILIFLIIKDKKNKDI